MPPIPPPTEGRLARRRGPAVVVWLVLAVSLLTGCSVMSRPSPAPTPADFPTIASEFAKRGITLGDWVSGDAGCTDPALIPTSIGFDASGLDQTAVVRVHIYIFRNRDSFERLRSTVDNCARTYVTDPNTYESIEASPFVIAAQGPWGPKFEAAIRDALTVAAGTGG